MRQAVTFRKYLWLGILLAALAIWAIPPSTKAHESGVSLTGVGAATIDGVLSVGEWDNAGTANFDVNVAGGGTTVGTVWVMNDRNNLYLAVRYGTVGSTNTANFTFDNDHSGTTQLENGDDVILHNGTSFFDSYRTNEPPCPFGLPPGTCGFADTTGGGTTDGTAAFGSAGGVSTFEFSHPLNSADDAHDISLVPGDTVGFHLRISMIGAGDTVFPDGIPSGDIVIAELNQPPDCSAASPSLDNLWPPNHKFVPINVTGVTDPNFDTVSINIDSIRQDEPVNGKGDGNTSPDGQGIDSNTAEVRAERSGKGNGRVYEIGFTASDGSNGTCTGSVIVEVPHDKKGTAVNDGPTIDSTSP